MIELVYFEGEHYKRAPGVVGRIYNAVGKEWITTEQIVEAVQLKMPLTIRPANDSEMKRLEAVVAMYEIGQEIAKKFAHILDQDDPAEVEKVQGAAIRHLNQLSCLAPLDLLDRCVAAPAGT
jgi:hypothetical protein